MQRRQTHGNLIDLDIELVDAVFHSPEFLGGRVPAFHEPHQTGGDGRFHQAAHFEKPGLQFR